MIGLLQRVRKARVCIAGEVVGEIDAGLLLLVCAEQGDTEQQAEKLLTNAFIHINVLLTRSRYIYKWRFEFH